MTLYVYYRSILFRLAVATVLVYKGASSSIYINERATTYVVLLHAYRIRAFSVVAH